MKKTYKGKQRKQGNKGYRKNYYKNAKQNTEERQKQVNAQGEKQNQEREEKKGVSKEQFKKQMGRLHYAVQEAGYGHVGTVIGGKMPFANRESFWIFVFYSPEAGDVRVFPIDANNERAMNQALSDFKRAVERRREFITNPIYKEPNVYQLLTLIDIEENDALKEKAKEMVNLVNSKLGENISMVRVGRVIASEIGKSVRELSSEVGEDISLKVTYPRVGDNVIDMVVGEESFKVVVNMDKDSKDVKFNLEMGEEKLENLSADKLVDAIMERVSSRYSAQEQSEEQENYREEYAEMR